MLADHHITLGPGEVAEFDPRLPHWFGRAGDQPVEILSLLGRQGNASMSERCHAPEALSAADGVPDQARSAAKAGLIRGAFDSSNPVTLGLLVAGRRRRPARR